MSKKKYYAFIRPIYKKVREDHGCNKAPCYDCWAEAWHQARKAGFA